MRHLCQAQVETCIGVAGRDLQSLANQLDGARIVFVLVGNDALHVERTAMLWLSHEHVVIDPTRLIQMPIFVQCQSFLEFDFDLLQRLGAGGFGPGCYI